MVINSNNNNSKNNSDLNLPLSDVKFTNDSYTKKLSNINFNISNKNINVDNKIAMTSILASIALMITIIIVLIYITTTRIADVETSINNKN